MLDKLLDRISQGGSFSTKSLAQELGVSEGLFEAMLADLIRAGYLQQVERCRDRECVGCSSAATCKPREKVWILSKWPKVFRITQS
jgi:FeoC like transcriptional regulator